MGKMTTSDARCTSKIKSRTITAREEHKKKKKKKKKKKTLFTSKMDLTLTF